MRPRIGTEPRHLEPPEPWHNKYRPKTFDEVIGQNHIIPSLQTVLASREVHAFLFTGPTGCGKSTLAALSGKELGATEASIITIAVAELNSVKAMRRLIESV